METSLLTSAQLFTEVHGNIRWWDSFTTVGTDPAPEILIIQYGFNQAWNKSIRTYHGHVQWR